MLRPTRPNVWPVAAALCVAMLALTAFPPAMASVRAHEPPAPTPATVAGPDRCEPNESPERACPLQLDAVNGPFTFLPSGDQDVYRVDLGDSPTGLATEITVRRTPGLDLRTTIARPGDAAPLALIASPAVSATLPVSLTGIVLLRVENRAPAVPTGEAYNLELRRVLPPPPPVPDALAAETPAAPDRLENNWSPEAAAPIGVGFVYDLNFVCPVPWGCVGGDHDYLSVPVKAGLGYLITTFDLGPGVDTVIDLFWGDASYPAATNDDARPGASFLSTLRWRAPADGMLLIRVAPRTGGAGQVVFDEKAGGYRFAIALADSDLGRQLERRLAEQTGAPAPTTRPTGAKGGGASGTGASAPAPHPTVAVTGDGPTGPAVVIAQSTVLREAPGANAAIIQTLPQESGVALLGQASGGWVRVQPDGGVVPGWVYGPDLRRVEAAPSPPTPAPGASGQPPAPAAPPPAPAPPKPTVVPEPRVTRLEPAPPEPAAPPAPRASLSVAITVVASDPERATGSRRQATPEALPPVAGVRVQLVTVFGDLLAEAVTPADGRVTLTRELEPGMSILLQLPALGVLTPVDPAQPALTIAIPSGGAQ